MNDLFLFVAFPYLAVAVAVGGVVYRTRALRHSVTARSSQLLEGRVLYWGSVPWHVAILVILSAHLAATVVPAPWAHLLGSEVRVYLLEITGLALGVLAVAGIASLLVRRIRLASSTSIMDWILLLALALQATTGVYIAFTLRWGAAWYVQTAAPWLLSLARFAPQIDRVAVLPPIVKIHAVNAFVLIMLLPLSKLVHATAVPLAYLWRPPQLVVWRRVADEETTR